MAKKQSNKIEYRPPIVAFLGHVDHGKTTILDAIRKTGVQAKEVGGITQSITCWTIDADGKPITFIDTPGHEAFNLMRSRGGEVADIVVLVVAADDGVKPQTKESIEIIKSTKALCIVAINKIDIAGVDIDKVKRDLSVEGLLVEGMGGDIPVVELSGQTGQGIKELLEMINLLAEVNEIGIVSPVKNTLGSAFVLESLKDKSCGNTSTVVVTAGNFVKGKTITYLDNKGELVVENIKGMLDEYGDGVENLGQGYGAKIIGISNILEPATKIYCLENKKQANISLFDVVSDADSTEDKVEELAVTDEEEVSNDDLLAAFLNPDVEEDDGIKKLKIVLRASSQGSLQALQSSLEGFNEDEFLIEVVQSGIGNIYTNDVEYAKNLGAIVIGFGVEIDKAAEEFASKNRVLIRIYDLIYSLLDELEDAAVAMQQPDEVEKVVGEAEVREIFILSNGGRVVGMRVTKGEVKHGLFCRVLRDDQDLGSGKIISMQCGKDKVTSMSTGRECGGVIDFKDEIKVGDILECYRIVKN